MFKKAELQKYLDETFNLKKLQNRLANEKNIFLIALYDKLPIGYAKIKLDSRTEVPLIKQVQLQKIYVLQEFLNKKVGLALFKQILNIQEVQDREILWLTVLKTNLKAIKFYQNNGFTNYKIHYHQIGSKLLEYYLMIRILADTENTKKLNEPLV